MAQIAVLLTNGFVEVEYAEPAAFLRDNGHQVIHVGPEAGKTVSGQENGTAVKIDRPLRDVSAGPFDALLILRGCTFEDPNDRGDARQWVKVFWQMGKPIFVSRRLSDGNASRQPRRRGGFDEAQSELFNG